MSIVDTINRNTSAVTNGKMNLKSAIINSGGTVSQAGLVPTFQELINGLQGISGGGGGTVTGARIFSSVSEMQAASGVEDDLAIVYGDALLDVEVGNTYTELYFPPTIVFDRTITGMNYIYLNNSSTSVMNLTQAIQITASSIQFYKKGSLLPSAISAIKYTSSDGITYTRTDSLGEYVTIAQIYSNAYTDITVQLGNYDILRQLCKYRASKFFGAYMYKNSFWTLLTNNQDMFITENGTYVADEDYSGLGEVTVEVDGVYIEDKEAVKCLADETLAKGEVCSLLTNYSDVILQSRATFPTSIKTEDSSGTITTVSAPYGCVPVILNKGEIIFISSNAEECRMYPFIKTRNGFEQMKVDGHYYWLMKADIDYPTFQSSIGTIYDADTDVIYADCYISSTSTTGSSTMHKLTIDRTNKNLISSVLDNSGYYPIQGAKGHFFIHSLSKNNTMITAVPINVNATAGTETFGTYVQTSLGISSANYSSVAVVDSIVTSDNYCIALVKHYTSTTKTSTLYVVKYSVSTTGLTYVKSTALLSGTCYGGLISNDNPTQFFTPRVAITNTGFIYASDSSNILHKYKLNISTLACTEVNMTFSDDLDISKVAFRRATKEDDYLYIISTDEAHTTAEQQYRLYKYDSTNDIYQFICCPADGASTPLVQAQLTRNRSNDFYNIESICFDDTNSVTHIYEPAHSDYAYTALKNDSKKTVDNVDAYGIMTSNTASGEIGDVVVVLKQ